MPSERRKTPRLGLAIPLRIQGFLADRSTWEEFSTTTDVSSGGACFSLVHEVDLGQVLLLSLALPKRLRQYDLNDVTYRIYSLVRGVRRRSDRPRVGVMFFGKFPPRGFEERPAARYLLPSDSLPYAPAPQGLQEGYTQMEGVATPSLAAAESEPSSNIESLLGEAVGAADAAGSPSAGAPLRRARAGVPPAPVPGAPTRRSCPPARSRSTGAGRRASSCS